MRSAFGCHENSDPGKQIKLTKAGTNKGVTRTLGPLKFFFLRFTLSPCLHHGLFFGHAMSIGNGQKRSEIFTFTGFYRCPLYSCLSLARFKITADILIGFAGEFFTKEIEETESL